MDNNDIVSKIQKLLSLSESSNENESRLAMLKAQELLAKHKLSMYDVKSKTKPTVKVITGKTPIKFSTAKWKANLASVIADNMSCYCYYRGSGGSYHIMFLGEEDDVKIANIMLQYAIDSIDSKSRQLSYQHRLEGCSSKGLKTDYAKGFIQGLEEQYVRQKENNQEWGLVLTKHENVVDKYNNINFGRPLNVGVGYNGYGDAYDTGVEDGSKFSVRDKVEGKDTHKLK